MYSKKIAWLGLCALLSIPMQGEAVGDTQILIDRAHYWSKQGRSDMATQAWQAVLSADPANAEALAALADTAKTSRVDTQHEASTPQETSPVRKEPPLEPLLRQEQIPVARSDELNWLTESNPNEVDPSRAAQALNVPAAEIAPINVPVADPVSASVLQSVPVTEAAPVPAPLPIAVLAPAAVSAPAAVTEPKTVPVKIAVSALPQQSDKLAEQLLRRLNPAPSRIAEDTQQGGSLLTSENPSEQEMLDQEKYWQSHGRPDLAAKFRSKTKLPDQSKAVSASVPELVERVGASAPAVTVNRETASDAAAAQRSGPVIPPVAMTVSGLNPASGTVAVKAESARSEPVRAEPSGDELEERAKYWESRGRGDLAAKIRNKTSPAEAKQAEAAEPGRVRRVVAPEPAREPVTRSRPVGRTVAASQPEVGGAAEDIPSVVPPSAQELDERAQYWESRGRSDLAGQIRQKLAGDEPTVNGLRAGPSPRGSLPHQQKISDSQEAARSALEDSLLKNPNSLKTRLDLAQIYRGAGEYGKARVQIDSVLLASPDLPEALFASAQLYAEQHLWRETLLTLERISPASRTADMARLQKTGWAHVQLDRADALVRQGDNQGAEVLLREVAAELAISYNQTKLPEPPPLWNSAGSVRQKNAESATQKQSATKQKRRH